MPAMEADNEPHPLRIPRNIGALCCEQTWTSFSNGKIGTFLKLLVLDFFQASIYLQPIDYFEDSACLDSLDARPVKFLPLANPYLHVPLGMFEPCLVEDGDAAFRDAQDLEHILRSFSNLVDAINFVIDAVKKDDDFLSMRDTAGTDFGTRVAELQSICTQRGDNTRRTMEAMNRQLDNQSRKHAMREAMYIRLLTIFTAIYLPLSLSAALLSMSSTVVEVVNLRGANKRSPAATQSRTDTSLLFDFLVLAYSLGTLSMVVYYTIRAIFWLKKREQLRRARVWLRRKVRGRFIRAMAWLMDTTSMATSEANSVPCKMVEAGPHAPHVYRDRWRIAADVRSLSEMFRGLIKCWAIVALCALTWLAFSRDLPYLVIILFSWLGVHAICGAIVGGYFAYRYARLHAPRTVENKVAGKS
jgi:hypothetical protein